MKRVFLFVFLSCLSLINSQNAPYKIKSMKAFLYYSSGYEANVAGTLSPNIIENDNFGPFTSAL